MCTHVDHHCVNVFIHMLNFHGWSQPQNYFPRPMVDIHTYSCSLIFATANADLFFLLSSPEGLRTKLQAYLLQLKLELLCTTRTLYNSPLVSQYSALPFHFPISHSNFYPSHRQDRTYVLQQYGTSASGLVCLISYVTVRHAEVFVNFSVYVCHIPDVCLQMLQHCYNMLRHC